MAALYFSKSARSKIVTVPAGKGKEITKDYQKRSDQEKTERQRSVRILVIFIVVIGLIFAFINYPDVDTESLECRYPF